MFLIYLHSEQTRGWSCNVLSIAWRLWEFVANTGSNILELALHAWEDYPAVISAISFFPASDYPGVLGLDVKRWRTNLPPKSLMSLLALSPFYLWRPTARVTPPPPPSSPPCLRPCLDKWRRRDIGSKRTFNRRHKIPRWSWCTVWFLRFIADYFCQ